MFCDSDTVKFCFFFFVVLTLLSLVLCRFVLDTCRRLKEKKSYMVYTAVGCLGVSALCDLVKEVLNPFHVISRGIHLRDSVLYIA